MKISVIGTGYVGLVTGACLANSGNNVICVDVDTTKIKKLLKGEVPIYEPNLNRLLKRNKRAGRITFTTDTKRGVEQSDIIFLALPTPPNKEGAADLSYVLSAARQIAPIINKYKIIVNKSTVPAGTAEKITTIIKGETKIQFDVVSNPEFLREGYAVQDCLTPERIVIGTKSAKAKNILVSVQVRVDKIPK